MIELQADSLKAGGLSADFFIGALLPFRQTALAFVKKGGSYASQQIPAKETS